MRAAPRISNIVATMQAFFREMTPEPTLVPKVLATSLAPVPNDRKKATRKPAIRIQDTS